MNTTTFDFSISTQDIAVAQKIISILNGSVDAVVSASAPVAEVAAPEVAPDEVAPVDAPKVEATSITAEDIAGIIDKLGEMSESDLVAVFGSDNNKPYKVIRNLGFEKIASTPDFSYNTVATDVTYDQAVAAIDKIVKDVADGGLTHDDFENMFNYRTSKKVFANFTLDEIVEALDENDLI